MVFDLDGTLIDSAPDLHAALNQILGARGRRPVTLAEVIHMIGDGAMSLVARGFAATGEALADGEVPAMTRRYLDIYEANSANLTKPFPGAIAALERLRDGGVALGLCTNKPHAATLGVLAGLGLDGYFSAVLGGDATNTRKPDAGHLLATIEAMGADPATAVMVGDSGVDVAAAKNAGIPVIAVDFGYARGPASAIGADAVIGGFDELDRALAELWRRGGGENPVS